MLTIITVTAFSFQKKIKVFSISGRGVIAISSKTRFYRLPCHIQQNQTFPHQKLRNIMSASTFMTQYLMAGQTNIDPKHRSRCTVS